MSTYISTEAQYSAPISPFNFDLLAKVGAIKQQKYDASEAEIQNEVNNLINLDIAKGVDKEHLNQRVNNLITQINEFGSADLSISSNAQTIKSALKTAIDDKVMTAVASTRSIRNTQSQIEQAKASKDGLYDPANEYVAMMGVNDYLSNEQVGQKFQANPYTNFYDLNKELKPYLENLQDHAPNIKKQFRGDGDLEGYFVTNEGKELTPLEVRRVAEGLLGAKGKTQIQINGLYNYTQGNGVETILKPQFERYKQQNLSLYDGQIKDKEIFLKGNATEAEKAKARVELEALKNNKQTEESKYNQIMSSPAQMAYALENNKFLSGVGNQYKINDVSTTLSADSTWASKRAYDLDLKKFEYQKQRDIKTDAEALRLVTPTTAEETINVTEQTINAIDTAQKGMSAFIEEKLNVPGMEIAKTKWEEDYAKLPEIAKRGLTKEAYMADMLSQSKSLTIADRKKLDYFQNEIETKGTAYVEISDRVEKEIADEKLPSAVKQLLSDTSRSMIDPDTGKRVNVVEYLKINGITENNPENILAPNKAVVKRKILANLHANNVIEKESTLSKLWEGFKGAVQGVVSGAPVGTGLPLAGALASSAYNTEEYRQTEVAKRRLAIINGEDFASGNTPKTDEYIAKVREAGTSRADVGLARFNPAVAIVNSITNPDISNVATNDSAFNKRLAEELAKDTRLKQEGNFAIPPGSAQFEQIMTVVNAGNQASTDLIDDKTAINARINPDDPSSIIISQRQKDGKNKIISQTPIYLQDVPLVSRSLDFSNQQKQYTPESFKGLKQKVTPLSTNDVNVLYDMAENIYLKETGDPNTAYIMATDANTKEGIMGGLVSAGYGNVLANQNYRALAEKILTDPTLEVEVVKNKLGTTLRVNKNGVPLYTNKGIIPYSQLQEVVEKAKYTPMEIIGGMVRDMLNEKATYQTDDIYNTISSKYNN